MAKIGVTKASGERAEFSKRKLSASLRRSGADAAMVAEVLRQLEPGLYEGIPTKKIYRQAFAILKKLSKPTAARYSLKQGIMELGPSGFPFEKFVAEVLKTQGYTTRIGSFLNGKCVRHEIDIIAIKDGQANMIECKFHNMGGTRSDVKTTMYIHSRFKDVESINLAEGGAAVYFTQAWVATNTRFTDDAIRYGTCMGMHLLGWDYPANGSLKDFVNSFELYPLTCLTSLSHTEKQYLLDQKLVICQELPLHKHMLQQMGMTEHRIQNVLQEVVALCGHSPV